MYSDNTLFVPLGIDPDTVPLADTVPSADAVAGVFKSLILSASGWRKVFAASGDEEDTTGDIGAENAVLAAHIAETFASYVLEHPEMGSDVVVGMDTRPTGTVLADIFCRVLLARGLTVHFPGVCAAPEIMAYARGIGPFAYISASHNPIGHNGFKFGGTNGGVFDRDIAAVLEASFRKRISQPDPGKAAAAGIALCPKNRLYALIDSAPDEKKAALAAYDAFTREIVGGTDHVTFFNDLRTAAGIRAENGCPVSLLADFNGSARTVSIDREFIAKAGFHLSVMNEKPRQIAHRIVPEGESLRYCAQRMEYLRENGTTEEKNTLFGYVPDCDGDRGNIVFWNEEENRADILEAQEVFALSAIAELSFLVYSGAISVTPGNRCEPPCAIAVNGPTSLRIEAVADAFGVSVARAEVGEANVVNLARSLRSKGILVRFLGEGSNGGNITHPSAVRDPLDTVFALLKLITIGDADGKKGLFHLWCTLSGQESAYRENFTFADIRRTLPRFTTTSVFEPYAQLKITSASHAELKERFRTVFLREWQAGSFPLESGEDGWNWKAVTNNGTETKDLCRDFSVSGSGGLKILFFHAEGEPEAFIWMRGSGTEPVFRIMADVKGQSEKNEELLREWLVRMVLEADGQIR